MVITEMAATVMMVRRMARGVEAMVAIPRVGVRTTMPPPWKEASVREAAPGLEASRSLPWAPMGHDTDHSLVVPQF